MTRRGLGAALLSWLLLALTGSVVAHGGLLVAELELDPDPPTAGAPVELRLTLQDRNGQPVSDAVIEVSTRPAESEPGGPGASEPSILRQGGAPGRYHTTVTLPEPGSGRLRFVDRTLPNESSEASVAVSAGAQGEPNGAIAFLFPPFGDETRGAGTWLLWLVGLPLLAAAVVTVLVLRRPAHRPDHDHEGPASRGDRE